MFRSPDDILSIQINKSDIVNILKDSSADKEKFILGIKLIYGTSADIGFTLLRAVKSLDTSSFVEPSFIEELLNPRSNSLSFSETLKIVQFILANASHTDQFEMAIHQHMTQYAQSSISTSNLSEILNYIKVIEDTMSKDPQKMTPELMQTLSSIIMKKMAEVPVPREAENIQTLNLDSIRIIEFFQDLNKTPRFETVTGFVLNIVYDLITKEEEVSPLACLGLAVIPENLIGSAVSHILTFNRNFSNQKKSILKAVGRLVLWLRTTKFDIPLHLWIVKVMTALHDEKHYDILTDVILEHIVPCYLTLILPAFQGRTFVVVQVMFETQRSEEVFRKIAPRFVKVLTQLENKNSEIFEPLLDLICDYVSCFDDAQLICKEVVEFLESHRRSISRSSQLKYQRLQATYSSLSRNVRIGLENLGNTCYINSVIQALFMTKPFCSELLTSPRSDRDTIVVQKIFGLLMFSERNELNLKFAMQQIRPQDFLPGIQQDSSEFMGSLLDKLHEADKKIISQEAGINSKKDNHLDGAAGTVVDKEKDTIMEVENEDLTRDEEDATGPVDKIVDNTSELNPTVVQKNFGGKISTTCVCSTCESKSISIDSFRDLQLSFPEKEKNEKNEDDWDGDTEYSVQQLLDYYFTSEQLTSVGENQYYCERCKSLCDGVRCTELLQPPKNLILTLKHFRYDSRYHTRSKLLINKMIHDEEISVNVRMSHEANGSRIVRYRLYAAVVHSGVSLDSGHYYTFAREKEDVWYKFNDSYVSKSTLSELHNLNSLNTPYILFYRRISTASATASSSTACSSDQIVMNEDKLPNYNDLPQMLRSHIDDDNASYRKESKKFVLQTRIQANRNWYSDDDDPPPSSCGGNFDVQSNRFIF